MIEPETIKSLPISRRMFCRSAVAAAAAIYSARHYTLASDKKNKVKFYKNLGHWHIGVRANQQQALDYAVKYGFDSITPNPGEFHNKSSAEIRDWVETMKAKGIRYGSSGLPVQYRRDEKEFQKGLARLPEQVKLLGQLGIDRMVTWITPGHNELTYLKNFERHRKRLRQVAKVLRDSNIRFALEFVGPKTSQARFRFPFICTQRGMTELIEAIDTGNVGLLLDSWHWYTSHGTVEELLQLSNKDVIHVHVNDAPAGIPVNQQIDTRRKLPVTTSVIDLKGFINALVEIGYDGPVECEPFDRELSKMEDEAALKKTIYSLNRLWDLITV
ncbi:MAG: TIM barrel protein [Phycisphaerae bacterium]|nr:TIM barrel protein [Phycisphaerae bacterium]NIP51405.1 TIM barrel protein [Phycisphaerae bacterium]NIS50609.1 TIM barrel protein [Phycisphaerae bacterium]NIU08342.1 TIM barrel protein [Phycisphaerae bacterium]NIU55841.1 TIM barrel protein [Phycisphaerae bacterium]